MGLKIVTISDTHNKHKQILIPDGDIILHAGDATGRGERGEIESFVKWYGSLPHKHKIMIAGNHDWGFDSSNAGQYEDFCKQHGVIYLNDSGCEVEGIKIWGSPVQPAFCDWAFNRARSEESAIDPYDYMDYEKDPIGPHWDLIPYGTDILITHGPPMYRLDKVGMTGSPNTGQHVGCEQLNWVVDAIRPKMHVFGHIHERRGVVVDKSTSPITYVNAASLTCRYVPHLDETFVFDWDKVSEGNSRGRDYED